ncbi:MATE family efflux transporter [Christensenella tenuis]|jgi:putative MATE family efflux protein|uniref:Probable multidrug resistance protein NorM n=1 Tax=Christensenella tenuis TaxID=2763033 RepID=A0ABR7ECF2_9FIRM|nr:MATE family efflux transporter [Christensenella tenuis]MBC5647462.1 MATE family efflux transporter [Christensenella tenuis]
MNIKIQDLTSGNVTRTLLRFAGPMFLANLLQSFYSIVDMVVVGRFVGSEGLAAVSSASMLVFLITSVCTGIAQGGAVLVAQYEGAGQKRQQAEAVLALFVLAAAFAAAVTAAGFFFYHPALLLMRVPQEAAADADGYMGIICGGTAFVFGYNAVCAILRGLGDSKRPLYFVLAAAIVNVALDLLLVGRFHMGTRGAAVATVSSQGVSFFIAAAYLWRSRLVAIHWKWKISKKNAAAILRVGLPSAGQMAVLNFSYLAAAGMLNVYGVTVAAASGIGLKVNTFAAMPVWAVGQAVSAMAGQAMGKGDIAHTGGVARAGTAVSVIAALVAVAFFQVFAPQVVLLFDGNPEVVREGVLYLRICCSLNCVAYAVMYTLNAFATGLGDASFAFWNSMLDCVLIRIFGSWLLGPVLGYGFIGIYIAEMFAPVLPAIAGIVYFRRGKWKLRRLV